MVHSITFAFAKAMRVIARATNNAALTNINIPINILEDEQKSNCSLGGTSFFEAFFLKKM